MTQLHPIVKIKKSIDLILQYDKSLFIEKAEIGGDVFRQHKV